MIIQSTVFNGALRTYASSRRTMDSRNLDQFVKCYRQLGRYRIVPMKCRAGDFHTLDTRPAIVIEKHLLEIVPVRSIDPHDVLRVAPRNEDDPVMP